MHICDRCLNGKHHKCENLQCTCILCADDTNKTSDDPIFTQPIEEQYKEQMQIIAQILDKVFNEDLTGNDRKTGFVLLVFPFGDAKDGRCNYISNGTDRADMVKLLREQSNRFDINTV